MTKPTEHDIRALFSDSAEETREWIYEQLDAKAELLYSPGVSLKDVEYLYNTVEAEVYEGAYCSCCNDVHRGRVELTVDDLVGILNDDESLRDKVKKKQEAERIAKEAKAKAAEASRKLLEEQRERQEYQRLKRKFGQ